MKCPASPVNVGDASPHACAGGSRALYGLRWPGTSHRLAPHLHCVRLCSIITGDANKRVRDHLQEELKKPIRVKLKDKLSFSGGVFFLLLSQYMVLLCVRARVLVAGSGSVVGTG